MNSGPSPRPPWHRAVYALVALIFAVFLYVVLSNLTDRITRAEEQTARAVAAAERLSSQVEQMGGTPVVDTDELPEPEPGEPGATGASGDDGAVGEQGEPGEDGEQGARGQRGPRGLAGQAGAPGAVGAAGDPGPAGADGTDGAPGPAGPQGEQGPVGERGPQGEQGPAGPTCPTGYRLEERDVTSTQNPLGEPSLVCVRQEAATP